MATSFLENLPEATITADTIRRMYRLVDAGKTDDKFQRLVYGLVNRDMRGRWKDYEGEVNAVYRWFKERHDYRRDPYNVELLQDVWATLDRKRFDCDDACIFLGAACEVLGAPARFITVSTRADGTPSHVYLECFLGSRWVPIDATVPWATVGWEPTEGITNRQTWTRKSLGLSGDDEPCIEGLGMNPFNGKPHWEGGFSPDAFEPPPPTGLPQVWGHTWAEPPAGDVIPAFAHDSDLVAESSQIPNAPAAGGGDYTLPVPIDQQDMTPEGTRYLIPRDRVPVDLDLNRALPDVPLWDVDARALLPQPTVPAEDAMSDLAGLAGAAETSAVIGSLASSVADQVRTGEVPNTSDAIKAASGLAVSYYNARTQAGVKPTPTPVVRAQAAGGGLPSWLIPAGIVGVVLLAGGLAFMTGGKRR